MSIVSKPCLVLLLLVFFTSSFLLSCQETSPTTIPAPVISPIPAGIPEPVVDKTLIAEQTFDEVVEGWQGIADEGAVSEVSWSEHGHLAWQTDSEPGQITGILCSWPELTEADGLTIGLSTNDRNAVLMLGVQENDGSVYNLVLFVERGYPTEHDILFEGFGLHPETEDENGKLDKNQLAALVMVDISSSLMAPRPNTLSIDYITLWQGRPAVDYFACGDMGVEAYHDKFRTGIDASFIPQGERLNHGYFVDGQLIDPLELFSTNGVDSFRLRLFVGEEGDYKIDYATELAHQVQDAGIKPYLVMFLSDDWSDVNKQPVPAIWADLTYPERREAIRRYAFDTTRHFQEEGITFDFYEIGNEIDYGICGVFADTSHPRDVKSLQEDTWHYEGDLIKAAIEGIKEVDPEAKILLHIAKSWESFFTTSFFKTMKGMEVDYDYIGLSFYPTAFGMAATAKVCQTLDHLTEEVGKPIIICETAYPAHMPTGGMFVGWRYAIPGYPLTPAGQARWLTYLLEGMKDRGDVRGVYYFSPDFWFSGDLWEPFALFDDKGNARPAIGSFHADD